MRESVRLSQVQDIAGCRVVVPGITEQDNVVAALRESFERVVVVDRRVRPSHGYRAVHAIVTVFGKTIEVQIRTKLQHEWAELSEKIADRLGVDVKYGGGPETVRSVLVSSSELIADIHNLERTCSMLHSALSLAGLPSTSRVTLEEQLLTTEKRLGEWRAETMRILRSVLASADTPN